MDDPEARRMVNAPRAAPKDQDGHKCCAALKETTLYVNKRERARRSVYPSQKGVACTAKRPTERGSHKILAEEVAVQEIGRSCQIRRREIVS